ncbi:MAG: peptidylprolyl isomerase [Phenylobacterium sp.]|uniref:peptidylprolyl isomerase n=1 Tax=Phenylobacterium sp. TaxID=1871053 RepID=UPI00273240A0|nr:peptidylprolyl isomerase [Phenylobacterium sp.]MDP1641166.1 peptidylprolyl isomerase [Phenylobacterium sp.]MDP3118160.1 peptidylprolyl isomerase [Phenylobacterium sp.]
MKTSLAAGLMAALLPLAAAAATPAPDWRPLDPAETLVIDTTKGRIVVEMAPQVAPQAVARVKLLAKEGVYDGLQFHRVIAGFVAQTGNPGNQDGGASDHPDLPPEFTFRLTPEIARGVAFVTAASDARTGFLGSLPISAVSGGEEARARNGRVLAWGAYCAGVFGMGRQADPGTANSEIFVMLDSARRLDRDYTPFGRVIAGFDVAQALAVGEPPETPDQMIRVALAANLPAAERPSLEVADARGALFQAKVAALRTEKGADFTLCDVEIPVRGHPTP